MGFSENSTEGDVYIQRLATYVRRHEEGLANGLVSFSKRPATGAKPLRLNLTLHHLYFVQERIEASPLGVDVGPLTIKLDHPNHEPTFISFMATNARSSRHFESDARSISSINSMKSIVSSASMYWRSVGYSRDPKVIHKDLRYLYSSFTKIPCLVLSPKTKMPSIQGYEEYPCDTSVPLVMFKNLQVLELVDYEPHEVFGWHVLAEQLRILIIKNSKISDLEEVIVRLVSLDESGRTAFRDSARTREPRERDPRERLGHHDERRERASTLSSSEAPGASHWTFLKQLSVCESSISYIPPAVFAPLASLVKLNLSNNLLEAIPDGLHHLVHLKNLNLADNLLVSLVGLPDNLRQLATLNLNNNKLTSLEGLNRLASLEKVDLRRNRLKDMASLKPVVLQYIKNPTKFNNVYLANNLLPKTFRVDLFNLFNGIKYKNTMRIDDSRPGYFESALLLDADSAFHAFERYFGLQTEKRHQSAPPAPVDALASSFRTVELGDAHSVSSNTTTITTTSNASAIDMPHSAVADKAVFSLNQHLSNVQQAEGKSAHSLSPVVIAPSPAFKRSPSSGVKRSPTRSQLDLETSAVGSSAPGVITPVQVTARMST
ncbi:Leucine-rich repeat-containing protein [[Candida] zeylanoides]